MLKKSSFLPSIDPKAKISAEQKQILYDIINQHVTLELPNTINEIYEKTYKIYAAGHYGIAKSLFDFLIRFNPQEPQYLYGYASCCLMLKEYEQAADYFVRCGILEPKNPVPYFYAADCFMYGHDLVSTCTALKTALKRANDQPEYAEIKQRAKVTLEALASRTGRNKKPTL